MKTPHSLAAAAALLLTGSAHAAYTAYIYESSGNVLASGSGSLNLAGTVGAGVGATVALMAPTFGLLHTGVASLEDHEPPYEEFYRVTAATAARINAVRESGGRVVASGEPAEILDTMSDVILGGAA